MYESGTFRLHPSTLSRMRHDDRESCLLDGFSDIGILHVLMGVAASRCLKHRASFRLILNS